MIRPSSSAIDLFGASCGEEVNTAGREESIGDWPALLGPEVLLLFAFFLGSVPDFSLGENCRYSGYRSKVFHPFPICQTIPYHLQLKTSATDLQNRNRAVGINETPVQDSVPT
jgi:hypothetical protein